MLALKLKKTVKVADLQFHFSLQNEQVLMLLSTYSKSSASPYAPAHLVLEVLAQRVAQIIKAAHFCHPKQTASELSNESLLAMVNRKDGLRVLIGCFCTYSVSTQMAADDLTLQCEHINCELWLYIVTDLLVQCELELNNIYKIVQSMRNFRHITEVLCVVKISVC